MPERGEKTGGVTVHLVDSKLDNGPIISQDTYPISPGDTLEDVMARSKRLAAKLIIRAIRVIESGRMVTRPNPEEDATYYTFPNPSDASRLKLHGYRFL